MIDGSIGPEVCSFQLAIGTVFGSGASVYLLSNFCRKKKTGQMADGINKIIDTGALMAERPAARTFRELVVWQKAHQFVLAVYAFTATFPKSETLIRNLESKIRNRVKMSAQFFMERCNMTKQLLSGHSAIVTGAGRGFGKTIALRLAAEGAAVTGTARTQAELDQTVREIEAAGGRALGISGDAASPEDVSRIVSAATGNFGPVSILVNNAGIPGPFAPTFAADPAEWWYAQEIHIRAPFMFIRSVLPSMIERRSGCIIVVSAIGSYLVGPSMSAYCVGKTAQNRLIQLVAAEVREFGIGAFAIDPGFVITELAEITMRDPGARRWVPQMIEHLKARKADPESVRDLDRCAQRCVDLASGRYLALSGRYFELADDLDLMLKEGHNPEQSAGLPLYHASHRT